MDWRLCISGLIDSGLTIDQIAAAIGVHLVAYVLQNLRWALVSDTLAIPLPRHAAAERQKGADRSAPCPFRTG